MKVAKCINKVTKLTIIKARSCSDLECAQRGRVIHRWLRYVSERDRHRLMNQFCFVFDDEIRFVYLTI